MCMLVGSKAHESGSETRRRGATVAQIGKCSLTVEREKRGNRVLGGR